MLFEGLFEAAGKSKGVAGFNITAVQSKNGLAVLEQKHRGARGGIFTEDLAEMGGGLIVAAGEDSCHFGGLFLVLESRSNGGTSLAGGATANGIDDHEHGVRLEGFVHRIGGARLFHAILGEILTHRDQKVFRVSHTSIVADPVDAIIGETQMLGPRRSWIVDVLLVFAFAVVLTRPLWKLNYTDNWASIESTFIADARILKDHWPRPLWHPYWYVGTRFDYIYPPALRYGTAAIAKFGKVDTARAYHIYTAFFYCFGIAGVYLLARIGFRNRWAGLASAFGAAVVCPSYLFLPRIAADGFRSGPNRLNALVRYGEGPHMTAFAWIPVALALTWLALKKKSVPWALGAGVAAAAIVSNNFYGATALAMLYPLVVWAIWASERNWRVLGFALIPPAVAYGLTAFWLTPSYLVITLRNMQFVSEKGNAWSGWLGLLALLAFLSGSARWVKNRPERAWNLFVLSCVLFFTINVVGNYWLNFRVIGEPLRLVPELDLILDLAIVMGCLWLWERGRAGQVAVAAIALAVLGVHYNYLRHHRAIYPLGTDYKNTVYWRTPQWIAENYPEARSYVTGAVRFWYNTWHDLYQLGGSSEQGLENPMVMPSQWEIVMGPDPKLAMRWLQVMGVDLVAIHGPQSDEWYKDFLYPKKFDGVFRKVHEFPRDNHIYEVPRRYRSMARIVDRKALDALPKVKDQTDLDGLERTYAVYEQGPEAPTETHWRGTDLMEFRGKTGEGQSIILMTSYDPAWRVESNLGVLPAKADGLGFVRVDAPAGVTELKLRFVKPLENTAGEVIFLLTLTMMGWALWRTRAQS